MPQYIETPNGVIEFPDGMPAEQIQSVLQKQFGGGNGAQPTSQGEGFWGRVGNALSTAGEMIPDSFGAGVDAGKVALADILRKQLPPTTALTDFYNESQGSYNQNNAEVQAALAQLPEDSPEAYGAQILNSTAQMAPSVAAGLINPALGLGVLGSQVYSGQYADARSKGRSIEDATLDTIAKGTAEFVPSMIPFGRYLKPATGSVPGKVAKDAVVEGGQEGVTSLLQDSYDQFYRGEKADFLDNLKDSLIIGTGAGAATSLGTAPFVGRGDQQAPDGDQAAQAFENTLTPEQEEARQARIDADRANAEAEAARKEAAEARAEAEQARQQFNEQLDAGETVVGPNPVIGGSNPSDQIVYEPTPLEQLLTQNSNRQPYNPGQASAGPQRPEYVPLRDRDQAELDAKQQAELDATKARMEQEAAAVPMPLPSPETVSQPDAPIPAPNAELLRQVALQNLGLERSQAEVDQARQYDQQQQRRAAQETARREEQAQAEEYKARSESLAAELKKQAQEAAKKKADAEFESGKRNVEENRQQVVESKSIPLEDQLGEVNRLIADNPSDQMRQFLEARKISIQAKIDGKKPKLSKAQAVAMAAAKRRVVDLDKDDLIEALRKQGGIDVSVGEGRDFRGRLKTIQKRNGLPGIEQNGKGMSLDRAAEWATEQGYIRTDADGRVDLSELADALSRSESGEKVYSLYGNKYTEIAEDGSRPIELEPDEVNTLLDSAREADSLDSNEVATDSAAFSKSNNVGAALGAKTVERIANRVAIEVGVDPKLVNVVPTEAELPASIQAEITAQEAEGQINAVYQDGKVHVVADRMQSELDVERALFHEALGHGAARDFWGNQNIRKVYNQLFNDMGGLKGITDLAEKHGFEDFGLYVDSARGMDGYRGRFMLVDEILAHLQERGAQASLSDKIKARIKELVGAVRAWLRDNGYMKSSKINESDLFKLLRDYRNNGMKGDGKGIAFQAAWHGTPHTWDSNKPSLEKIGTGEGAQAYGWGLYFAGNRDLAEWYRDKLTGDVEVKNWKVGSLNLIRDGEYLDYSRDTQTLLGKAKANLGESLLIQEHSISEAFLNDGIEGAKKRMLEIADEQIEYSENEWPEILYYLKTFRDRIEDAVFDANTEVGNLYEVDIPEGDDLLDWDKPLSQQNEKVQGFVLDLMTGSDLWKGYEKQVPKETAQLAKDMLIEKTDIIETDLAHDNWDQLYKAAPEVDHNVLHDIRSDYHILERPKFGENLYAFLDGDLGSDKAASHALNEAGIKGLRYLDAASRTEGEGHHNYVIWDEDVITVEAVNDQAVGNDGADTMFSRSKAKAGPKKLVNSTKEDIQRDHPVIWEAVQSRLGRLDKAERKRIESELSKHQGTGWAQVMYKSMAAREALEVALEGGDYSAIANSPLLKMGNIGILKAASKGRDTLISHGTTYGYLGSNSKAETDFSGSFKNCAPSSDCAKYCYATRGTSAVPAGLMKSEFTEWMAENATETLADAIANQFALKPSGRAGVALRMNEKGDLSQAQVNLVNALGKRKVNGEEIRLQIFSKRPELLSQIDEKHLAMLSIDKTNKELAEQNPELMLAVVLDTDMQDIVRDHNDKVAVYLPIKVQGKETHKLSAVKANYGDQYGKMRSKICPIDDGTFKHGGKKTFDSVRINKSDRTWFCTTCDDAGMRGCFHGDRQTAKARQKALQYIEKTQSGDSSLGSNNMAQVMQGLQGLLSDGAIESDTYKQIIRKLAGTNRGLSQANAGSRRQPEREGYSRTDRGASEAGAGNGESGSGPKRLDSDTAFSRASNPNGAPFKSWFGDSKVVDANGNPKVVYHGSDAQFDAFDVGKIGRRATAEGYGFYLTDDKGIAKGYERDGGMMVDAYLSMQKPLPSDQKPFSQDEVEQVLRRAVELEIEQYPDEIADYQNSFLSNFVDTYSSSEADAISEAAQMLMENETAVDQISELSNVIGDKSTAPQAVRDALGYDGIQVDNFQETDATVYVAWFPEQIKSASKNNGEFDAANPNIFFKRTQVERTGTKTVPTKGLGNAYKEAFGNRAWETISDVSKRMLKPIALSNDLPPEFKQMVRKFRAEQLRDAEKVDSAVEAIRAMTPEQKRLISDVVEKELKAGVTPPEHIARIATAMQAHLEMQSKELVELGMLSEEAVDRWKGKYLPRFYAKEDGKLKRLFKMGRNKIDGSHLKGRGLFERVPLRNVAEYQALGWEIRENRDGYAIMWRDFTRAERSNMGEIRDAAYRFARGATETSRDLALGRLFLRMANDPEVSSDTQVNDEWVQVPITEVPGTNGVKRYGALSGRWVTKDIWEQVDQVATPRGELEAIYLKALSAWKEGKTAMNPVVHGNNVVSNVFMADFAGIKPWNLKAYAQAKKDYFNKGEYYQEAVDEGLFGTEHYRAEINSMLPELQQFKDVEAAASGWFKQAVNFASKLGPRQYREKMSKWYTAEDQYFKLLIYRHAREEMKMAKQAAVDYTERYIFNYSDVPKGVRKIKNSPIGLPFFSYSYKALPALAHTAATQPWVTAKWIALFSGMNMFAYEYLFGDDADEQEEYERKVIPEYMKGRTALGTLKSIRLNSGDESIAYYLDMTRRLPMGDLFDVSNQMGGIGWFQFLMPNNPAFTSLLAILANKDSFTGREVVRKSDDAAKKAERYAEWMFAQFVPNSPLIPASYSFNKVMNGIASATGKEIGRYNGMNYYGEPQSLGLALADTLTGTKVRRVDNEREYHKIISEYQRQIRDAKAQIRSLGRNGSIPNKAKERDRLIKRIRTLTEKIQQVRG